MLPKANRNDKKAIEKIFKEGRFVNSPNLTFKFVLNNNPAVPRVSFIAPKGIAKLAVKRNLLRRRGYAILGKYIDDLPTGLIGAFVFRKSEDNVVILENEIKNILSEIS